MTLGGGCEVVMASSRVVAAAETYIGLVEVGVGLIPAGTGSKEVVRRMISGPMATPNAQVLGFLQQAFEQVGLAKVATSAVEGRAMHYLTDRDRIVVHPDHLLGEAKREAVAMAEAGYRAPDPAFLRRRATVWRRCVWRRPAARGAPPKRRTDRRASRLCAVWRPELSAVGSGGLLLRPQREAFVELCKEPKTIERIWYMLQHNKPLRN
jgi:3-hydroxyacyl-CoA dehydrogenase